MADARAMEAPALAVHGLGKRYGKRVALDALTLELRHGEVFGLLGANGAGKTTALRLIGGLIAADAGSGQRLGRPLGETADDVGYVPQRGALYEDLSVAENLRFFAAARGLPREQATATLAAHDLAPYASQRVGKLSGGWRQRTALAAALLHAPRLLLLDEPTAGLDPDAREVLWRRLRGLAAQGVTMVVTTHYADEAARCERIGYLRDGRLALQGKPAAIAATLGLSVWRFAGGINLPEEPPPLAGLRRCCDAQGWRIVGASTELPAALAGWCGARGVTPESVAPQFADALAWLAGDGSSPQ